MMVLFFNPTKTELGKPAKKEISIKNFHCTFFFCSPTVCKKLMYKRLVARGTEMTKNKPHSSKYQIWVMGGKTT